MKKIKFSLVIPVAPERDAPIVGSLKEVNYSKSKVEIIVIKGKNPSENRNKGFKKSSGEIIGFLDDDATADENILKNVEEFFEKYPEIDIVGGPQLTPIDEGGFAKISGYALSSKFGAWKIANRYSGKEEILDVDETALTSANLFCRKKVLKKIKFDTKLFPGEDPKFIDDARKNEFKVAYSPKIIVYHKRRQNVKGLIKQIFNYGKTRPMKENFLETLKKPFFLVPSLFVGYLIFLNIKIIFSKLTFFSLLPLVMYFILNLLFSIYESIKNKDFKSIFILPFVFLFIHLSYGIGIIWGYLKK